MHASSSTQEGVPDTTPVADLDRWTRGTFTADGVTHPTYRRGTGPGVILDELPGSRRR